jgi:hypothetical protein
MNDHPIVQKLRRLGPGEWRGRLPADPNVLATVEQHFKLTLPGDYRAVLLFSSGGGLYRHTTKLELESAEDLIYQNEDERFEDLKGMLVIGGDASDCIFYYDPDDRLGKGAWALYEVELSLLTPDLAFPRSKYVGRDLGELVDAILSNESLYDRPYRVDWDAEGE